MEKQVLSIEQMRHLQELGVDTSKANMCWIINRGTHQKEFGYPVNNQEEVHKRFK